jgi:RAT1-interacting protein
MKIPAQIKERGTNMWDAIICINFTAKFLEFLRETISEDGGVYSITFKKGGQTLEVCKKEGNTFLTADYVNWKSK